MTNRDFHLKKIEQLRAIWLHEKGMHIIDSPKRAKLIDQLFEVCDSLLFAISVLGFDPIRMASRVSLFVIAWLFILSQVQLTWPMGVCIFVFVIWSIKWPDVQQQKGKK